MGEVNQTSLQDTLPFLVFSRLLFPTFNQLFFLDRKQTDENNIWKPQPPLVDFVASVEKQTLAPIGVAGWRVQNCKDLIVSTRLWK